MARWERVGSIRRRSVSDSGDEDRPKFIQCEDGLEPQIHRAWTFDEDGVTREVHPRAQVHVGTGFVGEFAANHLTPSWLRIPMFGVNSIYGIVQWLGIPAPLSTDGPHCEYNILAPSPDWGTGGTATNPNWGSQPGGLYGVFSVLCSGPVRAMPDYVRRSPENTRSAARRICDNLL